MKALVIETAFPGDAVLSIALADELKRIDTTASITYLVRPESKELLEHAPAIDRVIAFDKRGSESGLQGIHKKANELNDQGFDIVYILHHSQRTAKLLSLLNTPKKVGFAEAPSSMSLTNRTKPHEGPRTARCISLLRSEYENLSYETLPTLAIPKTSIEPLMLPQPLVTIAPGSVWETKCWPADRFRSLASKLISEGLSVAIVGSKADNKKGIFIAKGLPKESVRDLTGRTSLLEAAAVIQMSKALIANDSAPIHLATAVRTPSVAIFGPTIPTFGFAPPIALGTVIELRDLWCRPCSTHGGDICPIHTHECMERLEVGDVFRTVQTILRTS